MTSTRRISRSRPSYFRGQLLDETDFRAEQDYHRDAWRLHLTRFHSWGVVDGLTVSLQGTDKVVVSPGVAIDSNGREVGLDESVILDLAGFASAKSVYITLSYEEEPGEQRQSEGGEAGAARMVEYSVLAATTKAGAGGAVTLARVDLAPSADEEPISYAETPYASSLVGPGRVGYRELESRLQSGWVRLPFKPIALIDKEPFLIGPTEAKCSEGGAAGSMAIPVPPGVTRAQRFRIAGERNEGTIAVEFFRCGWDPGENDHERTLVHSVTFDRKSSDAVPAQERSKSKTTGAFKYTSAFDRDDLDPEHHALSVVVTASNRASISLVAVEFGYASGGKRPRARAGKGSS